MQLEIISISFLVVEFSVKFTGTDFSDDHI